MKGNIRIHKDVHAWSQSYMQFIDELDCLKPSEVVNCPENPEAALENIRILGCAAVKERVKYVPRVLIHVITKHLTDSNGGVYRAFWDELKTTIKKAEGLKTKGIQAFFSMIIVTCKHMGFLKEEIVQKRPFSGGMSCRASSSDIGDLVKFRYLKANKGLQAALCLLFYGNEQRNSKHTGKGLTGIHNGLNLLGFSPETLKGKGCWQAAWNGERLFVLRRHSDRQPKQKKAPVANAGAAQHAVEDLGESPEEVVFGPASCVVGALGRRGALPVPTEGENPGSGASPPLGSYDDERSRAMRLLFDSAPAAAGAGDFPADDSICDVVNLASERSDQLGAAGLEYRPTAGRLHKTARGAMAGGGGSAALEALDEGLGWALLAGAGGEEPWPGSPAWAGGAGDERAPDALPWFCWDEEAPREGLRGPIDPLPWPIESD